METNIWLQAGIFFASLIVLLITLVQGMSLQRVKDQKTWREDGVCPTCGQPRKGGDRPCLSK